MTKKFLSSCENRKQRIKHTHLTKSVKRYGVELLNFYDLSDTFFKSDISNFIGCLPPELCKIVEKDKRSETTKQMFELLDFFFVYKGEELSERNEIEYELKDLEKLFHTKCILETAILLPMHDMVYRELGGLSGNVYRISFPELKVSYALKVFRNLSPYALYDYGHGAMFEIMTAFCANKSEPKRNNPVYMANLFSGNFMLSKWQEEKLHQPVDTMNVLFMGAEDCTIYQTSHTEIREDNYINGKRIDFGETYKTEYGNLSYNGRKIFRKIRNMEIPEIKEYYCKMKTNVDKTDFENACGVLSIFWDMNIKTLIR